MLEAATMTAPQAGEIDWQADVFRVLKEQGVKHVVYVPDAGHSTAIRMAESYNDIHAVLLTTEEEGIGYLAGAQLHAVMARMGVKEEQMTAFPDQPTAIAALQADRVDGFANTSQGNDALLAKVADPKLVKAHPFQQASVDGKPLISFGALGFRPEDADFHQAFNDVLTGFVGSPEHLAMVKPFGFGEDEIAPAAQVKIGTLCSG